MSVETRGGGEASGVPRGGPAAATSALSETEYDLHGIVGIRLVDAAPADADVVTRQVGAIRSPLGREPDVVVRFVDELDTGAEILYLGVDDAAFTDDAFLVLRSKHKSRAKVRIAFDQIGGPCEIVCERGLPAVPLLIPIINLTALAKGAVPLHASAFVYNGTGAVVTGWTKGGKTEALLAFMARGAEYVGDEWVYVSPDGKSMFGIPEPIRLWDWHLRQLPQHRDLIDGGERARLAAFRALGSLEYVLPRRRGRLPGPLRSVDRILPLLRRQLYVDVDPDRLFATSARPLAGSFDRLFFVVTHDAPGISVAPVDPLEVARRMVSSLEYERQDFIAYYLKFRFAFPDKRNALIDRAEALQADALARAFAGKPTFAVHHPYPMSLAKLFDAMSSEC